jgi:tetratricopeptide (TPR) repeat protein
MFRLAQIRDDYDGAVDYIDKCIALSGDDPEQVRQYRLKKAHLLAAAHKKTSDKRYLDGAVAVYESLVEEMPTNTSVLNNLAYMLAQSDRKLAEAQQYAEKALAVDPDSAIYLDTYAYVLCKSGKHAEAARVIAVAIQQYEMAGATSGEVYEHLGMIKEALGQKESALAAYRRALDVGHSVLSDVAKERIRSALQRLEQG